MPFTSKAQQGYLFANKPDLAKRWAKETSNFKSLPNHKSQMNKKSILKKYTGKGGPGMKDLRNLASGVYKTVNEIPGTVVRMNRNLKKAVDPGDIGGTIRKGITGLVSKGITKYKNFKADDDRLNKAAAAIQGNVSSNEGNVNEFLAIKRKLKKQKMATTT